MMGLATASQWLFNFVVAKATPSMFATLGPHGFGTYFVYGSFCFCAVTYAWFFVPDTKGLALEDMDELFARRNIRAKFVPRSVGQGKDSTNGNMDKNSFTEHVEDAKV
jgi:hypothetical protein